MKVNELIYTPRFEKVIIRVIFESTKEAYNKGYTEPTHYHKDGYTILGKHTGLNLMIFAAVKEYR